ncbi:type II toxin-antitoxin system YoeB family toxin [candidate division WOR-3 bacterium]|nr:type II toxin-antitoxin system YoeB family toxin [candidate division WOR-3 bacterium]
MIQVYTTETFDHLFGKLERKIQLKAVKKTDLFKETPFNPILRTEKLHPKGHDVWSFRVDSKHRIVFKFIDKDIVEFRFIGHHNKIYNYPIFFG